jgi:hypothetical protein
MSFRDKLQSQYISPALRQKGFGDLAVIIAVNRQDNTATIKIENSQSPADGETHNYVPLPFQGGIEGVSPNLGDIVWVQYLNGDKNKPFITTLYATTNAQYINHKIYSPSLTKNLVGL